MKKCIKITITGIFNDDYMQKVILTCARQSGIEGLCQRSEDTIIKIFATGKEGEIDHFLDLLYMDNIANNKLNFSVESFLQQTDFRGVFRVIE